MKPLIQYCEGAVKALTAQYEMTKVIGHAVTMGTARERLIFDFLTAHLPELTSAVSGVIVDSEGNRSKQQDIVLMLKSMPRLRFASGSDLIFQEGVIATFEIKTNISAANIPEIAANIQSVKALQPTSKAGVQFGALNWPWARVFHAIVTYDGVSLRSAADSFGRLPEDNWPDFYLDLSKGCLMRNEGILFEKSGGENFKIIDDGAKGLAHFLTQLAELTGNIAMREVKWKHYME